MGIPRRWMEEFSGTSQTYYLSHLIVSIETIENMRPLASEIWNHNFEPNVHKLDFEKRHLILGVNSPELQPNLPLQKRPCLQPRSFDPEICS